MFISFIVMQVKIGHSGLKMRETGSEKSYCTYKQPSTTECLLGENGKD